MKKGTKKKKGHISERHLKCKLISGPLNCVPIYF